MEPTISLSISIKLTMLFWIPSINRISYYEVKYLEKNKKIVVGKVIAAKAIGIFILYIGRIHFVINRLGRIKE